MSARGGIFGCAFVLSTFALFWPAAAQQTPALISKPVRIVVPGPPGGPAGATAQLMASKVARHLGQTVIADFRPGAGGNIAIEHVSRSPGDGFTLFFAVPALVTNPFFQKVAIDPFVLAPVIPINSGAFMLLVHPQSPWRSTQDVIAAIQAKPGDVSCSTGAVALSTVSCHLLQSQAGKMLLVGYPGNAQAMAALERGEIQVHFDFMNVAGAAVKAGRLRALAVTSAARASGEFATLPPLAERIPGVDLVGWQGIMAPKETPPDIIARTNAAFNAVLAEEDVIRLMAINNLEMGGGSPEAFAARVKKDFDFYGRIAREAKIDPQ